MKGTRTLNKKLLIIVSSTIGVLIIAVLIIIILNIIKSDSNILDFHLYSDKDYIFTGEKYNITFTIKSGEEKIKLYGNRKKLASFFDDGNTKKNGDLKANDGIFSAKIKIKKNNTGKIKFYAKTASNKSNKVIVSVKNTYSHKDLNKITQANKHLKKIVKSENFYNLSIQERKALVDDKFKKLINKKRIKENGVFYNDDTKSYGFQYFNGDYGVLDIGDKVSEDGVYYGGNAGEINSFNNEIKDLSETGSKKSAHVLDNNALIIFDYVRRGESDKGVSFDEIYRLFKEKKKEWDKSNLPTEIITNPTVEYYKTCFIKKSISLIGAHGTREQFEIFGKNKSTISVLEHLNDTKYKYDISKNYIARNVNTGGYQILPEFFEHYYSSSKIPDTIILMGNCYGFGTDNDVDYTLSENFKKNGANAIIGSVNESYLLREDNKPSYSLSILFETADKMLDGVTVKRAFEKAKEKYGNNADEFVAKYSSEYRRNDEFVKHYSLVNAKDNDTVLNKNRQLIVPIDNTKPEATAKPTENSTKANTTKPKVLSDWKQTYIDFFSNDSSPNDAKFALIKIDNDDIPEIVRESENGGNYLYWISNNEVVDFLLDEYTLFRYKENGNGFLLGVDGYFGLAEYDFINHNIASKREISQISGDGERIIYEDEERDVMDNDYWLKVYNSERQKYPKDVYCTYSKSSLINAIKNY
ncbi:MAG: hypothetical protein VZQ55_08010 [Ruminococcus sp.]|nr:hypothetical protein [Ruminococcus sp.]